MTYEEKPTTERQTLSSPGYHALNLESDSAIDESLSKDTPSAVRPSNPATAKEPLTSILQRQPAPSHLVLTGDDRYLALAYDEQVELHLADNLSRAATESKAVARFKVGAPVRWLANQLSSQRTAVIAALANRSLVEIVIAETRSQNPQVTKPRLRTVVEDLGGGPRALVSTRQSLLVVIEEAGTAALSLLSIDPHTFRIQRRARLPLSNITSIEPLDSGRSDLLVAVDSRHGAHIIGFPTNSDDETLQVIPVDADLRATAITALNDQWLVVARKGGDLIQVSTVSTIESLGDSVAAFCRRLRELLERCGCACHQSPPPPPASPKDPADPKDPKTPAIPGGTIIDDEPCRRRKRASLGWTVVQFRTIGKYIVAIAAGGQRLAVLDQDMNLLFERFLGARGSLLTASTQGADRLLSLQRGKRRLEAFSLDEYVLGRRAVDLVAVVRPKFDPSLTKPLIFRGRQSRPASPNPHLKVCVFTITEPGQPFGDPDQTKMQAQLVPNVYDVCKAYYLENSFQTLTPEFTVFGVHLGAPRPPLVLPRSFASYFYDRYSPGGIEATMPGNWAAPPVLDGTEAMTLRTDPSFGSSKDYPVPFAALWTSRTHDTFPVQVNFTGTEAVQLQVIDKGGTTRNLNVVFGPLALSMAQGGNEATFLNTLGTHITNAIRTAESAAGAPTVVQDVKFRRIRANDDDTVFGSLQGQIRIAPGGALKGRATLTPPATVPVALTAIGFDGSGSISGVLGSATQMSNYFRQCVHAAQYDSGEGEGLNDPQLDASVDVQEDVAAQNVRVRIQLAKDKGGAGAEITLVSSSELAGLGWSTATSVPGSQSTANNSNTMRQHQDLANDVFTAAMNHIRATTTWNADTVRAQFADFDAMMIGFVGACPTSVPLTNRWSSADAADFARLRMFVRLHQATDLANPNPSDPPVTMGTDLLIGQRFNQFDPGVMTHEIGHGLGLPDLYSATGYRNDVDYIDQWCQMAGSNSNFNHFCAWAKWSVGWIVEDPGNPSLNRVIDVPMPSPSGQTTTEAWLCPVEYWDNSMRADIEAAVGTGLPVGQMMKVALGSDGGVVDLIELRAAGINFSRNLPPTPAIVVTNVLQPGTDRRWAVNGLYRRSVHLLNRARILRVVGDRFDFAAAPEFPVKGTNVQLMELRTIRGTIPIARVSVVREAAQFIDLFFQDNVPSWRSPDIWVDWAADNSDPNTPREYPEGTPTDQGETVRFPSSGFEKHFLVVRPHNAGNVRAEDVKVRWFICDPPGAGDDGRWVQRDTQTIPIIDGGTWKIAPFVWNVDASTNAHQCIRGEIIDWKIPAEVDPATGDTLALGSDDVILQNNNAQKNVFEFEAAT